MSTAELPGHLDRGDRALLSRLRTALHAAEFTAAAREESLLGGVPEIVAGIAVAVRRGRPAPLVTLAQLFWQGIAVSREDAERSLAPATVDELSGIGLLDCRGGLVRSRLRLDVYEGLIVAADFRRSEMSADAVLEFSDSARTLDALTVRRPVGSVLDLGTGSGIHALRARAHAAHAVGVDISPRSLAVAGFNAALNGVDDVEFRLGSWLEPVAGERFDLILANPPYALSPDADLLYRDSALGDLVPLLGGLGEGLADGGIAQTLFSWPLRAGEEWSAPLRKWISHSGCHALLVRLAVEDPLGWAVGWNRRLAGSDPDAFALAVSRWTSYFETNEIAAIGFGMVALQRRPGAARVHAVEADSGISGPAGEHILRLLRSADALELIDDDRRALEHSFVPLDGHRIDQTLTYGNGRYGSHPSVMWPTSGLNIGVPVPAGPMGPILGASGGATLSELVQRTADRTGADYDVLACDTVIAVRELVAAGLLMPSPIAGACGAPATD